MAHELLGDEGFRRELADFAPTDQQRIRDGLRAFTDSPLQHPQVALLHGSEYPGSFRLRIGAFRVLGIILASQGLILLTTVFRKKRDSDYDGARRRHEQCLALQGPPLQEFLRSAKRRR